MGAVHLLAVAGPTTEITGVTTFSRWQYELILYSLVVAAFALGAAGVFSLVTRHEISKRYRSAAVASTLITWVATLAYLALILVFLTKWHSSADGTTYSPVPGTFLTGLRYADWSVTVPLLSVELLAVCTLPKTGTVRIRFTAIAAAFLMIVTGFLGVIAVGQSAGTAELLIWGAVSTVFFIVLYAALGAPVRATLSTVDTETATSLRNATVLLFSLFGVYPIVYLIPLWASPGSAGWATTIQVAFTVADIAAKAGFGVLIHKVAKLRTAAEAEEPSATVPDEVPEKVYLNGHLISLPAPQVIDLVGAEGPGRAGRSRV